MGKCLSVKFVLKLSKSDHTDKIILVSIMGFNDKLLGRNYIDKVQQHLFFFPPSPFFRFFPCDFSIFASYFPYSCPAMASNSSFIPLSSLALVNLNKAL